VEHLILQEPVEEEETDSSDVEVEVLVQVQLLLKQEMVVMD
jgi:hypothetical protein